MTSKMILQTLHTYQENLGRCEHLEIEIKQAEAALIGMQSSLYSDVASPNTQNLDGMPHGHKVTSPTETIAIMLANGELPRHIADILDDLRIMRAELAEKQTLIRYVDAWLKGLTDQERWIIQGQVISGKTWRTLMLEYESINGEYRSKDSLKRLRARALKKIFEIAR